MIKKIFALLVVLLLSLNIKAGIGDWNIHTSYCETTYCQVVGNKIYVLASGALFSYNKEDGEVYVYDNINELNDTNITHIAYCKNIDALVIVYKNANIDLLYSNGEVYNISDFKNKILPSKIINSINIEESTLYMSTSFGVVVLNLEKHEFTNTYNLKLDTFCSYVKDNFLYIGTEKGMYKGSLNDNLLDFSKWVKIRDSKAVALNETDNQLLYVVDKAGAFLLMENLEIKPLDTNSKAFKFLYKEGDKIYLGWENKLTIIEQDASLQTYAVTQGTNFLAVDGNTFWSCKGIKGLVESRISNNTFTDGENYIQPNSPVRNNCEFMKFINDEKLLVAGGTLNYFDITFIPGTVMEYNYSEGKWYNFREDNIKDFTGVKYVNVCSVDEDPTEEGHYFAGSFGQGLYEFRNREIVAHYNHKNSPLQSPVSLSNPSVVNYIRVPKVEFDNQGNLWIVNTHVEDIVKVLKKDGTWLSLKYDDIAGFETVSDIFIDSRGWLWAVSTQGDPGLFCAQMNNTPFDTSDDKTKTWLNNITNQDGTNYTIYTVFCAIEDKQGEIWVGTDNGLFVIRDAKKFFNDGIFTQIKVPRNDGTGLADYLLSGTAVSVIKTDGANRKWIGTKNNGIYLVSADGIEMIHHFTKENSILPSNNITSIAVNGKSGEVFIGTDGGIVSFMSNATEPAKELNEDNVHAYPNPVRASYSGNITITGVTHDCELKIVDAAGYLINEGHSTGGSYTWNGRNAKGEKVASGVYYVLMYDENGDESIATKILITR